MQVFSYEVNKTTKNTSIEEKHFKKYVFENGGRSYLLKKFGLSNEDIILAPNQIID